MNNGKYDGILWAVAAFIMWGLLPVYWKALKEVPSLELLCHRIVWSLFFVAGMLLLKKRWHEVFEALKNKNVRILIAVSSSLIAINWFVYLWSVNNNHVVEASLGYYINPLINALLGFIFLKDRLSRMQTAALLFALAGVLYSIIDFGRFPYIALTLALSFGFYGLVRKVMKIESLPGLFIEIATLTPLAAGYLLWLANNGQLSLGKIGPTEDFLLLGAGVATSLPLICFAHGARRLKLATLGILQYIAPTIMLSLGVFMYGEPFGKATLITFIFIWTGIAIYMADEIHTRLSISKV